MIEMKVNPNYNFRRQIVCHSGISKLGVFLLNTSTLKTYGSVISSRCHKKPENLFSWDTIEQ